MSLDDRNEELNKKLEEPGVMTKSIEALVRGANRQRIVSRWLAFSIGFDLLLTVGLSAITIRTNELVSLAQNNKDAVIQNCQTANESRANQIKLWTYVFNVPPSTPRTPEQQKTVDDFKAFVNKTFQQRDCSAEIQNK